MSARGIYSINPEGSQVEAPLCVLGRGKAVKHGVKRIAPKARLLVLKVQVLYLKALWPWIR